MLISVKGIEFNHKETFEMFVSPFGGCYDNLSVIAVMSRSPDVGDGL